MQIRVYSDGSATSEGKPGGYGWCLVINGSLSEEGSGYMESASNNDSELQGAIEGLKAAYKYVNPPFDIFSLEVQEIVPPEVTLVSDSKLILGWASGKFQFKQLNKIDKYHELQKLMKLTNAKTEWVRGHSGDEFNTLCDKLANQARLKISNKIITLEKKEKGESIIGKRKTGVICLYYGNQLKVIDLKSNLVEDYNRELHGSRGGILEVREEKLR